MEIIDQLERITKPFKNAVITIGNFDGVHLGHRALFQEVIEKARATGGTAIAMTFEPHPIRVLKKNGQPPLITLYEQKVELFEKTGIEVLICIHFTPEFAALTAREFVEDLLVKRIGMKAIIVGEDYTFGKNREGDLDLLKAFAKQMQFEVIAVGPIQGNNEIQERISSTRIRELINDGRVDDVEKILGRHYQIRGVVVSGRDRGGKVLGFPTANLHLHDELCPKRGVYAVIVESEEQKYHGVANIGFSPTFKDHEFTVEVHILDFNENIYNKKIRINFVKRIRDEIKFSGIAELSQAICKDVADTREILSGVNPAR
jgi:riboflavin kinase/FMN adenylyltransferase